MIDGVIDITTTEVADFIGGGVFPCLEDRFGAIARTRVPHVVSCGALDMVNFGEKESVPERYCDRKFYFHNPQVTLLRTNVAENLRIGEWIRSEEHTSELQSLMRISYAIICLEKKKHNVHKIKI